jgi:hypothetical protein
MPRRARFCFVVLFLAGLSTLACNLVGRPRVSPPSIVIVGPPDGSSTSVNRPLVISAVASDPHGPGVARVELLVDGQVVHVADAPGGPQPSLSCNHTWLPEEEGQLAIMAMAYREDGATSAPASVTVRVVDGPPDSAEAATSAATTSAGPDEVPGEEAGVGETAELVQGRTNIRANIRSGPGELCAVLGAVPEGELINLLEYSADDQWLKTDGLTGQIGWIWSGAVAITGDAALIPRGDRLGCSGCGDGLCGTSETCQSCPEDCGNCCGNGICEATFEEGCNTCESDCGPCCGNDVCEEAYGEDCEACPDDCGACEPECGDGVCQADQGEHCNNCEADCGNCADVFNCGDGICDPAAFEGCYTCPEDCGDCCGDGVINALEDCEFDTQCAADEACAACTCVPLADLRCGDGYCNADGGEDCVSCPEDCPICEDAAVVVCGDGECFAYGESRTSCPEDCVPACGDGTCMYLIGETIGNCPADCADLCGDDVCMPRYGEDCLSCPEDCPTCDFGWP